MGDALKLTATVAVPATISANYQAIVHDMAIKAGIAGTARETQIGEQIAQSALPAAWGATSWPRRSISWLVAAWI